VPGQRAGVPEPTRYSAGTESGSRRGRLGQPNKRGGDREPVVAPGGDVVGEHLDQTHRREVGVAEDSDPRKGSPEGVRARQHEVVSSGQACALVGEHSRELVVVESGDSGGGDHDLFTAPR